MRQISQSQFISICDTLCEIVKGLNDSQVAATLECVVSRLCSTFDSVVIPPMAAIKKTLDLLVKDLRLDFMDGAYYFKCTVLNSSKASPREKLNTSSHTTKTEAQTPNRRPSSSKRDSLEKEKVTRKLKPSTKLDKTTNGNPKAHEEQHLNKKNYSRLTNKENSSDKKLKRNIVVKSNSLKVRMPNHCLPRRQYSYEELHSKAKTREMERKRKQSNKRNSFLGKLSRLFKMGSSDDAKLSSNDEACVDSDVPEHCHDGWEKIVTDERVKLLSHNNVEIKRTHVPRNGREKDRIKKSKDTKRKERSDVRSPKINKKRRSENLASKSSTAKRDKSKKKKKRTRRSTGKVVLPARSPEWLNANFRQNNRMLAEQNSHEWRRSQTVSEREESSERHSLSSFSELSCSLRNSDYSLSSMSGSSFDGRRKSFHYSEEDTSDDDYSTQESRDDGASNFCSTQAICGDLEMSTLSLQHNNNKSSSTSSSVPSIKQVDKHPVTPRVNKNGGPLDHAECQQNTTIRSRNLVQLIGIL